MNDGEAAGVLIVGDHDDLQLDTTIIGTDVERPVTGLQFAVVSTGQGDEDARHSNTVPAPRPDDPDPHQFIMSYTSGER